MSQNPTDMEERVARAIYEAGLRYIRDYEAAEHTGYGSDPFYISWSDVPDEVFARAAIEATDLATLVEQAFRDGITYGSNVSNADPDLAWQHSRARAAIKGQEQT